MTKAEAEAKAAALKAATIAMGQGIGVEPCDIPDIVIPTGATETQIIEIAKCYSQRIAGTIGCFINGNPAGCCDAVAAAHAVCLGNIPT